MNTLKSPWTALGVLTLAWVLALVAGCGTTVGNPARGDVTFKSSPYNNNGMARIDLFAAFREADPGGLLPSGLDAALGPVTEFKFCNTQIKITASIGGVDAVESQLGLVDASNPDVETVWGTASAPVGLIADRMDLELHVDDERCSGVTYSVRYNGTELTEDLEFRFRFDPPILLEENDVVTLGLTAIASALEAADQAGKLNNTDIHEFLDESVEGTGEDDD
ncbi:MAG: hypothetical protein IT285_15930 [Bdellovibrionales bacterium]|nr:hypothetical protein [Bdellovibrionales bacterium]